MDRFEEDFFQQSFNFELLNENLQIGEINSENFCLPGSSENNFIEICKKKIPKQNRYMKACLKSHLKNYSNFRKNQQSQFMQMKRKSNFSASPLKGILKMPQSHQNIYFQSSEIKSSEYKKERFKLSDKMTGKRRPKRITEIQKAIV
ncbi:unnamed protein product [Paramecium octaurelia]|uniref:Uncharacterized protein n=1 Tax=Paramecium octaurelia TaxID=43137 RepID=A0A8S1XSB6_PAROT|nr:unnamed protein product [Paramecium octaurelia]